MRDPKFCRHLSFVLVHGAELEARRRTTKQRKGEKKRGNKRKTQEGGKKNLRTLRNGENIDSLVRYKAISAAAPTNRAGEKKVEKIT